MMNSIILITCLVVMSTITGGNALTREERRRRMLKRGRGELIFQGDFVYDLYKLGDKAADPFDNLTITFRNNKYVYKDNAKRICLLKPSDSNQKRVLSVVGGIKCPYDVGQQLQFNETGFTIPALPGQSERYFNRNFGIRRVKRQCTGENFKLLQCQKEDFQRVMLLNGRKTWNKNVWYVYHQFLHRLICRCALLAKYDYFPYFTISDHGLCHGVERKGVATPEGCVNGGYKQCIVGKDEECTGEANFDAIYQVNYDEYDSLLYDSGTNEIVVFDEVHADEAHSNKIQSDEVHSDSDKKLAPIKKEEDEVWRYFQKFQKISDEVQSDSENEVPLIKKEVDDLLRPPIYWYRH